MKKKALIGIIIGLGIVIFGCILFIILDNSESGKLNKTDKMIEQNKEENKVIDDSKDDNSENVKDEGMYFKLNENGSIYFEDDNLKEAIEEKTKISNITPEEAEKIDILLLTDKKIKSIKGLEFFKGLTVLDLDYNYISDISVLKNLTKLKYLSFHSNQVSDITILSNLTNLEFLAISSNRITDVSSLVNLKKLHYFPSMYNNNVLNMDLLEDNLDVYYQNLKNDYYEIDVSDGGFKYLRDFGNRVDPYCEDGEAYSDCMARFNYDIDKQDMKTYKKAIEKATSFVKNKITDNMTDLEKEIVIIEYLVDTMYYEETDGDYDGTNDFYYPLVLGYGQCHNYAQAFNLLAYLSGLESYSAFAGAAHEWNIVKIDGIYYHLDITWADIGNETDYTYINLSTKTMNNLHGLQYQYTPTDILEISNTDMKFS